MPTTFDVITMAVREQLSGSRSSPPIYSHFRSRFWICPQIQLRMWEFLCQEQWWEKFPHSQLDLGANPESAPEMAINSLPLAHIFSCSLTAMVITSHMNGHIRQVEASGSLWKPLEAPSTHLGGG